MKEGDDSKVEISKNHKYLSEFKEFIPGEGFDIYMERFENYLDINDVTDELMQKKLLLHFIGEETYKIVSKMVLPGKPKESTYKLLKEKLEEYFNPKRHKTVDHYHFNKRSQLQSESVIEFASELQYLAGKCEFGTFRDTALRDRFVGGLLKVDMAQKLLNEKDLTFTIAIKLAQTLELSERSVTVLKDEVNELSHGVNKLNIQRQYKAPERRDNNYQKVDRKYKSYNKRDDQKFNGRNKNYNNNDKFTNHNNFNFRKQDNRNLKCYACGKLGHIRRFCRSNGNAGNIRSIDESFDDNNMCNNIGDYMNTSVPEYRYL